MTDLSQGLTAIYKSIGLQFNTSSTVIRKLTVTAVHSSRPDKIEDIDTCDTVQVQPIDIVVTDLGLVGSVALFRVQQCPYLWNAGTYENRDRRGCCQMEPVMMILICDRPDNVACA